MRYKEFTLKLTKDRLTKVPITKNKATCKFSLQNYNE